MQFLEFLKKINRARLSRLKLKRLEKKYKKFKSFGVYANAIYVESNQGNFLVDPTDSFVSKKLLNEGQYAQSEINLASQFINKKSQVLILGAHIGSLAIPLAKKCLNCIVFEANPQSFELLKKNFLLNKISNVILYNKAVNNTEVPLEFIISKINSGGSKRYPKNFTNEYFTDEPEKIIVQSVILDKFIKLKSFDLIIADIEGSEFYAFDGAQEILKNSKILITEFIPNHLKYVSGVTPKEFWATLNRHFNFMYIPKTQERIKGQEKILDKLNSMFYRDENHDNLIFSKYEI